MVTEKFTNFNLQNQTILIIDDNPVNLGALSNYLEQYGFEILVARYGERGLKQAQLAQPDLILLDVLLPDHNGFEICRRLKATENTKGIPVIFMTILNETENKLKGFEAGAVDYITKPIQEKEVLARVTTQLRLRKLTEQLEQTVQEHIHELTKANQQLQQEINERKQAEKTSDKWADVFKYAEWGIVIISPTKNILKTFNPAFAKMHGYTVAELMGKANTDILAPAFRTKLPEHINLIHKKGYHSFEAEHLRKDGTIFPVQIDATAVKDNEGNVLYHIANVQDITKRKQTETILRNSEERYRSLFENIPIALLEEDFSLVKYYFNELQAQGIEDFRSYFENNPQSVVHCVNLVKVLDMNQFTLALFGVKNKAALLTNLNRFFVEESYNIFKEELIALAEGHTQFIAEGVGQTKQGDKIILNLGVSVAPGYEDTLSKVLVSMTDITQPKAIETERENLITELETKNAELERFTYTVSHDLKSPLITIRGFLGLLEQDALAGDIERMKKDIRFIHNASTKMGLLLDDLLELSRIGRIVNLPESIEAVKLIDEVITLAAGQIAARGIDVNIASYLPNIYGDPPRLLEIFKNLIDNAIKFMGNQPQPCIEIGVKSEGEETIWYIRDNGIGIEPRYHEKIFKLFDRLDEDTEGTGIGLALVKRIVEVHRGRIWIESEGKGSGSTFYFTLSKQNNLLAEGK